MIFAKFLFFTKGRRSVQTRVTGVRHKNQLDCSKLMISVALPHKYLP